MNRPPTLAEILSEDTGIIRPEVADLLLEPRAPRTRVAHQPIHPPPPQARPRRHPIGRRLLVFGLIVLLLCLVLGALLEDPNALQPASRETPKAQQAATAARTGRVIGIGVSIRTQPGLQGEIIKEVNQDEILKVLSFHNGWYRVALSGQVSGYIFGAYLIPQDFDSSSYRAAITKDDQTKLLVIEKGDPSYFAVLWPDGQTTRVLKDDVAILQ